MYKLQNYLRIANTTFVLPGIKQAFRSPDRDFRKELLIFVGGLLLNHYDLMVSILLDVMDELLKVGQGDPDPEIRSLAQSIIQLTVSTMKKDLEAKRRRIEAN